jgi:KUP system potassium uptake protein
LADSGVAPILADQEPQRRRRRGFAALTVGALGVVFGDIGTSPLYALREALAHARPVGTPQMAVLGVVSLILWTLTLIVTIKYVAVLMRADNRGEGGAVALMALTQRATGRRAGLLYLIGVIGVALFFGDGVITPAFSVVSAVEGLRVAPHLGHVMSPLVLPVAAGILIGLFLVQSRGTSQVASLFGPVMGMWFAALAALGVWNLAADPGVLLAVNPYFALRFLAENHFVGFVILGSVFLAVTGAEALYADMGQFGRRPVRFAWLWIVWPCLALNYLGQGAFVLHHPFALHNPFFEMTPHAVYWPVLFLATAAAVIASQAVITGAFSMTRQAIQLGLIPRIAVTNTSATQTGQIFVPAVNSLMMVGVFLLLVVFQSSHRLASAYGVAVTGTMFISTCLAAVVARRLWKWRTLAVAALFIPIAAIDFVFLTSNLVKVADGAWIPLAFGAGLVILMETWARGLAILNAKAVAESVPIGDAVAMLARRPPYRAPGTAIFLTSNPAFAPVALMHNLKHNKVLHQRNVILTIRTAETPRVPAAERIAIEPINDDFTCVRLTFGFMESPNVPRALAQSKKLGLKFDIMATTFFLGRRKVVPGPRSLMPMWQDRLFIFLMKNAVNPTAFFHIPPGRVVELGAQITV